MRNSKFSTFAITASIVLTALAGCGGSSQMAPRLSGQVPGITTQSVRQARAQGEAKAAGGLYIVQGTDSLPEYTLPDKKNRGARCSDSLPNGGVNGIAVDAHRILYVPLSTGDVLTFGPDCGAPGPTLVDPNSDLGDVAIDNKKNTVYVSNLSTGDIDVYKNGATSPTGVLSNSQYNGHGYGFGVAVDRFGNVFNSGPAIVEFPLGHNKGSKALALSGLIGPQGLSFDSNDNLLVTNEYNIAIYAPPYSGAPKQTITTQPFCTYSALDSNNKNLYVSEQTNNAVDVYAYPSGTFEYSISTGLQRYVQGLAIDPPMKTVGSEFRLRARARQSPLH